MKRAERRDERKAALMSCGRRDRRLRRDFDLALSQLCLASPGLLFWFSLGIASRFSL